MTRGRFITFEGGEGAGKSTQLRRLVARLEAEPGVVRTGARHAALAGLDLVAPDAPVELAVPPGTPLLGEVITVQKTAGTSFFCVFS